MSDYINNINIGFSSQNSNNYIKEIMFTAMEMFDIKIEQFSKLLGISSEKVQKILNDKPCILSDEEINIIDYRSTFISEGFSLMEAKKRIKLLIKSFLIDEYNFSYESLSKYAEVPYEVFNTFYNSDEEIESRYLINICVNLQMLINILKSKI